MSGQNGSPNSNSNNDREFDQDGHDKAGLWVFFFTMAFTTVFFIVIVFFSKGIDLKEINEEAQAAATQKVAGGAAAPGSDLDMSKVAKPWESTPEIVARGKQVFATSCAMCHGNEGKGDGVAGASLNPKPRNFVEGQWKKGGDSLGIFNVVTNGFGPGSSMVAWKATIPKGDRWALVAFIRSITKNKVPDKQDELEKKAPTLD